MLRLNVPLLRVTALSALVAACGRPALPDPRVAARAYADAAARGDSARVHALLSREARRTYGPVAVAVLVRDEKQEFRRLADAVRRPDVRVEASATVLLEDGSEALLALEDDEFRVSAAETLPSAARSPVEALDGLRRALARRSYPALLRVLSAESRGAVETDLRALAAALENPATLDVKVEGDRADVDVGGGHRVTLRREGGTWRVEDIE
jgi:hypothetical protein